MARGKDRKEIRDFSYGMDSTNYAGVISEELARMPLAENWRIRENGRIRRRGGYLKEAENLNNNKDILTTALAQSTIDNIKYVYFQQTSPGALEPTVFSIRTDTYVEQTLFNYGGVAASRTCGYNTSDDGDGHLYTAGWYAIARNDGGVIDVDAQQFRNWGIFRPTVAASVVGLIDSDPYDDIGPAVSPLDPGWFYFYTYARIVDGQIIAESAPSPLMDARFAPVESCVHKVTIKLSDDPQVTHIRFFRTTGESTGFEDGTAPGTASLVKEVAIGDLLDINFGGSLSTAFGSAFAVTPEISATLKCALLTNSDGASLLNLLDTWGTAAYGEPLEIYGAPFTPQGDWTLVFKESVLTYGNVTAYGTHAGNRVFYTDNRAGLKYKSSFYGWMDFPNTVTAAFVYKNDIIICTATQTYRVVDGNWTQVRLTVDGIGVLANNSCDFDPSSGQTLALTNKGVRAFNGNDWSADLSYQIKDQIQAITQVGQSAVALASGAVINREYYLALRGSFDRITYPAEPIICVGFLHNNNTIGWTIDAFQSDCYVQGSILMATKVSINESSYNEYPLAIMRVGENGVNHLVGIEQSYDKDFGTDKIVARLRIPRLIHQSLDNNIRVKYIKIIGNMFLPYGYTGTLPAITAKAIGDNGRTYQPIKIVNNALESPLDSYKYA